MAVWRCVLLRNVINGLCRVGDAVGHSSTLTLGGGVREEEEEEEEEEEQGRGGGKFKRREKGGWECCKCD